MLKVLAQLDVNRIDVFLDVGCGSGDIAAHVALGNDVHSCIGVEMQKEVLDCGMEAAESTNNCLLH